MYQLKRKTRNCVKFSQLRKLLMLIILSVTLYTVAAYAFLKTASGETLLLAANISADGRLFVVKNSQEVSARSFKTQTHPVKQILPTQAPEVTVPHDVLINSYMRSGSSFMGQLLAFRPDTFYWYEPLWNYDSGVYYWGKDLICTGHSNCGYALNRRLKVDTMHSALFSLYTCDFSTLVPAVAERMTPSYSGDIWKPYKMCRSQGQSVFTCLKKMEEICKTAKHRTTKIVRLTVDNLEYVLERLPRVKVVHLMRDPRAIINSRTTTTWYRLKESPQDNHAHIRSDAKDLCLRMKYDLKASIILKQKYPSRFSLVMFEDLQNDLISKSKILYSYFGINQSGLAAKLANMTGILPEEHTVQKTRGDFSDWWRYQLSFGAIKQIDSVCEEMYDILGYTTFEDESQLKNSSVKAFAFPNDLLLENLFQNSLYEFQLA